MTITTSKKKTYNVLWIDASAPTGGVLSLQMNDARALPKIASEFDGLTEIQRKDENQGDKTFTGYNQLTCLKRIGDDVLIQMGVAS